MPILRLDEYVSIKKKFFEIYREEYKYIHNMFLENYNKVIIEDKIDYNFVIFNEDFYFYKNLVDINAPFSLSWVKPKPILSMLETKKMIKEYIEYRRKLYDGIVDSYDKIDFELKNRYLIKPKSRHHHDAVRTVKTYCYKLSNLVLANSIIRNLKPELYYSYR